MRRLLLILVPIFVIALYVGAFSFLWLSGPVAIYSENGKSSRVVKLQPNAFYRLTDGIWGPGIYFMRHVCGYYYVGQEGDSISYWGKDL
jgi:hypothetical protein